LSRPEVATRFEEVEGVRLFYREAGSPELPVLLMLHGFPASSFYFRNLIPLVAETFHVIAPDYPGFGHSDMPEVDQFAYSFDHLANLINKFMQAKAIDQSVIYMQDYGGPIGMRLATMHPERITGLVFQNANVYEEGLSERFLLKKPLWEKRTGATEAPVLRYMEMDSVKNLYVTGARNPGEMNPDGWTMDSALLRRPGNKAIQLELQADYGSNILKYPEWQAYLRKYRPPTLVVWGKGDPIFGPRGAEAFRRDLPDAEIHLLNTGHFALEEESHSVACLLQAFISRIAIRTADKRLRM
jgi:pimeloyl-ACP methyl ester carboxylesterase